MVTPPLYEVRASARERVRVLLVLGRISNLPTVWSNCLAAWVIAGGTDWNRFVLVCASATFLYTGGMYFNDAFDVNFDREHRPERPIPSGQIQARSVWLLGFGWLALGFLAAAFSGTLPCTVATALLLTIIVYDWRHKGLSAAPWIMASCRLLVYLLAGSAAGTDGAIRSSVLPGLLVFSYIVGLSSLARIESGTGEGTPTLKTESFLRGWPVGLLFLPLVISLILQGRSGSMIWLAGTIQGAWVIWCIKRRLANLAFFRTGVAGLLAGIPLVDWLNAAPACSAGGGVYFGLFLLALVLQRWAPAT